MFAAVWHGYLVLCCSCLCVRWWRGTRHSTSRVKRHAHINHASHAAAVTRRFVATSWMRAVLLLTCLVSYTWRCAVCCVLCAVCCVLCAVCCRYWATFFSMIPLLCIRRFVCSTRACTRADVCAPLLCSTVRLLCSCTHTSRPCGRLLGGRELLG